MVSKSSLFIGDLDITTNETQISDHFNKALGKEAIQSVKVVREHTAPYNSRKYGYINFTHHSDADSALNQHNYGQINGKLFRLSWCEPDPSTRKTQKGNVCVKGLPINYTSKKLHELFAEIGPILSCRISDYGTKKSGHHGYVQYRQVEDAARAIERFNNFVIDKDSGKLTVEEAKPFAEQIVHNSTFVGGFPQDVTEEQLKEVFEKVQKVVIITSKDGNRVSRGFGFVFFNDEAQARRAVEDFNGKQVEKLNNATLKVQIAYTKWERLQYRKKLQNETRFRNMYVRGFPSDFEDIDLRELFIKFGNITSYKIMRNENKISKGFGFVCFEKQEDARKSLELSGTVLPKDEQSQLVVNYYQTKEERSLIHRKRYEEQLQQQQQQYQHQNAYPYGGQQPYAAYGNRPYPQAQGNVGQNYGQGQGHQYAQITQQQLNQRGRGGNIPYQQQGGYPAQQRNPQMAQQNARTAPPSGYNVMQTPYVQQQQQQRGGVGYINPAYGYMPLNQGPNPVQAYGVALGQQQTQASTTGSVASLPTSENTKSGTVDTEKLAKMTPEEQKQYLGELIYPGVVAQDEVNAGKITGMLLELDTQELIALLDDNRELQAKILEAQNVLREAQNQQQHQ